MSTASISEVRVVVRSMAKMGLTMGIYYWLTKRIKYVGSTLNFYRRPPRPPPPSAECPQAPGSTVGTLLGRGSRPRAGPRGRSSGRGARRGGYFYLKDTCQVMIKALTKYGLSSFTLILVFMP
jgi:hypothetical protein